MKSLRAIDYTLKLIAGWIICLLIRLIPGRPANIEPILSVQMPLSQTGGKVAGFVFGAGSILAFDVMTHSMGVWTLITAPVYGLVGLLSAIYLKNRPATSLTYVKCALVATILYDALTGLTIGPLFFNQPLAEAFLGQIPFTARHLLGNLLLALVLSPLVSRFIARNDLLEISHYLSIKNHLHYEHN